MTGRGSAPAPLSAPAGRGAAREQARWPRNYRRSATGLAARGRGSAPAPHSAPTGRGATRGQARWPRDYRRSAEGLAARRSGVPFEIVDLHSAVPSRCPSPCTASYKHGRYGMPFRPTQRKSQRDSNITLAFCARSSPGTRRRRAADYMDHSAWNIRSSSSYFSRVISASCGIPSSRAA